MARKRKNPKQRNVCSAESASVRCFQDKFGTNKAWNIWAVARRAIDKDFGPLSELRQASEHAVRDTVGHVPEGAEWEGFNAFMENPTDNNPFITIRRRFLRGESKKEVEEIINKRINSKKRK